MIKRLIFLPRFRTGKIEHNNASINIFASIKSRRSQCPGCGSFSTSVYDSYTRKLADLSAFQNSTTILLRTRKFKCKDSTCDRNVFSEQTPHTIRYSRRTARASSQLDTLSLELTEKLGSLLSKQLMLSVSTSTVTRIAMKQKLPEIIQPMVLGVDDWAFRKGVSYGTILIDMETSRPIELLASRESADLKKWLKKYPNVKIVTIDRASSYSSAINEVCPDAIQVADRFHLLMNLSDALDKYFKSVQAGIRLQIKNKTEEIIKMSASSKLEDKEDLDPATISATPELKPLITDQRIDNFNKVKELHAQGISIKKISKIIGICRNTIRSYIIQESLSPRISPTSTNIALFTKLILARLNTKGHKIKTIIDEILLLGFNGGRTQASHNINILKLECKINIPSFTEVQQYTIPYIKPLSSSKLAKYIKFVLKI